MRSPGAPDPPAPVPATMSAAYIDRLGPASSIRYGRLPVPSPGPDQVLVAVAASAVNAVDTFVRSGAYRTPMRFPFVIGRDLVGTVAAVGAQVRELAVGDPVWCNSLGHGGRPGAAAQFAVAAADRLYRLPAGLDPATAVALLHPGATAALALHTHGGLTAGATVLIAGAGGNVGRAATVVAAQAGARVLATAADRDLAGCRDRGAELAVDYRASDRAARLRAAAPHGVDLYVDTSGRPDLASAVDLLARRGRIVLLAGLTERAELPIGPLYTRDGQIHGFAISNATVAELAAVAPVVGRLLVDPRLPPAPTVLPLAWAAEAHQRLEQGHRGRLVLRP